MAFLVGLIVVLALANLLLAVTLARQVRAQDARLAGRARPRPAPVLSPGGQAPDFTVTTVDGGTRALSGMRGDRGVLAFLAPDDQACLARVPDLVEYARGHNTGVTNVIAVISPQGIAQRDQVASLADDLRPHMSVVIEPPDGALHRAYLVDGHPLFVVIKADGTLSGRGAYIEAFNGPHLRLLAE